MFHKKHFKFLMIAAMVLCFLLQDVYVAKADFFDYSKYNGTGSDTNLGQGENDGFTPGLMWSGYRVTILDKTNGNTMGHSVDYITSQSAGWLKGEGNENKTGLVYYTRDYSNILKWNNKVNYLKYPNYVKALLRYDTDYSYYIDNFYIYNETIDNIRSHFNRKDRIQMFVSDTGCGLSDNEINSGKYKILIEPMICGSCFQENYMLTATEYAILDYVQVMGTPKVPNLRSTKLEKAIAATCPNKMYLEYDSNSGDPEDKLGLKAPVGVNFKPHDKNETQIIINYLGMHLIRFDDLTVEIPTAGNNLTLVHLEVKDQNGNTIKNFDTRGNGPKWHYNNICDGQDFGYRSALREFEFNHTIVATQVEVYREKAEKKAGTKCSKGYTKEDENVECSVEGGVHYHYWTGNEQQLTINVPYKYSVPSISYDYFLPLDLRVERNMTVSEYNAINPGYATNGLNVDGTCENNLPEFDRENAQAIPAIDTNLKVPFSLQLNNDQFGIPKESAGGFDISINNLSGGSSIYKGADAKSFLSQNGIPLNTPLYFGAKMYAGCVTGPIVNGKETGSITDSSGKERMSPDFATYYGGWRGGSFTFRNIRVGNYKLSANGKNWWWAEFYKGLYYDYGAEYYGLVVPTVDGPRLSVNKLGPGCDCGWAEWKDKNFWVGETWLQISQPILYGEFESKTVGGNIN